MVVAVTNHFLTDSRGTYRCALPQCADRPSAFDVYFVSGVVIAALCACLCCLCVCTKMVSRRAEQDDEEEEDEPTLEQSVEMAQRTGRGAAQEVCFCLSLFLADSILWCVCMFGGLTTVVSACLAVVVPSQIIKQFPAFRFVEQEVASTPLAKFEELSCCICLCECVCMSVLRVYPGGRFGLTPVRVTHSSSDSFALWLENKTRGAGTRTTTPFAASRASTPFTPTAWTSG